MRTIEEVVEDFRHLTLHPMLIDKLLDEILEIYKAEQEPCEDAISRQAVKELYYKDGYIDFRKICELQPVTPTQKTGHWIDNKARTNLCNCSECGALSKAYSKYCSNCGAKMQEVASPTGAEGSDPEVKDV